MERGVVFNIQRYSVHDGPGIRTTVFLKGCPLRCAWCHNPEGITACREIYLVESLCIGCGECRRACPQQPGPGSVEGDEAHPLPPQLEACELCGACVDACPTQARRIAGVEMTVEQVTQEVLRDRVFLEESGGGVTFSGGEPIRQPGFLLSLLKACRKQGLHTAVDTCGAVRADDLLAVARHADLFLYDLKLMNDSAHAQYTGASNHLILNNLRLLGRVHSQIWLRVPFVKGVNDSEEELFATAKFAATVPGVRQVQLLPFHRVGSHKYQRLGHDKPAIAFQAPTASVTTRALEIFQQAGLAAQAGG